jgi:tetratricopeptide (TPR) repeat protein
MALGATDELTLRCRWEAYRQLGDEAKTAAALADLERYGRATVEATKVYNEAVALVKAGDHEGAFARFQEAVTIDPQLEEALLGVATQGLHIKRYQEALAAAEAILEDDPRASARARHNAALGLGDESALVPAAMGAMVSPSSRATPCCTSRTTLTTPATWPGPRSSSARSSRSIRPSRRLTTSWPSSR